MPSLVVVSGAAGSGKTTLAHELARAIGCPAICRDEIKEGMLHPSAVSLEPAPGDALSQRTLRVFFDALRLLLDAGVTVVAEAAFQDPLWRANLQPLEQVARVRVVRCWAEPATARERVAGRGSRPAHADGSVLVDTRYYDDFVPLAVAAPTIDVETTDGYDPSLDHIVAFVSDG